MKEKTLTYSTEPSLLAYFEELLLMQKSIFQNNCQNNWLKQDSSTDAKHENSLGEDLAVCMVSGDFQQSGCYPQKEIVS